MSNFREIAAELLGSGAAHEVADAAGLQREVTRLFVDDIRRGAMAEAGGRWHRSNAGAVERTIGVIREELAKIDRSGGGSQR